MFEIKIYIYAGKKCLMNHRHEEFWSKIISKKKGKKCIVFISKCLLAKYKKEKTKKKMVFNIKLGKYFLWQFPSPSSGNN